MSYHKQLYPDKRTSNRGTLARYNDELNSYVSGRIQSAQTEFFEYEEFEVTEVSDTIYGGVSGVFTGDINGVNREIKGDVVLPLYPNIIQIPLVGERIEVVEYSGQHYYSGVINRTNKPNENAIANFSEGLKYGETFERKDVKHIQINEGDIVFNGRFNSGIVLGSDDNKAVTKIVVGHKNITDNLYSQNIDSDDSSIYLLSDGTTTRLDGQRVEGKKVLIKSGGIFISSGDVRLGSSIENELEPVVKGIELKKIIDLLLDSAISAKQAEVVTKLAASGGAPTPETVQLGTEITELQTIKNSPVTSYFSEKVKTV